MLIAEINGKRYLATKGAKGICPYCKSEVTAKCGEVKVAHWAHKSKKNCDSWHEKETEWHRMWKNYFPQEWQEIIKYDDNGEKHIADVCTDNGFVLEFQHSPIKPEERLSREQFYKNMNWVVDGTRLKNDYKRFEKGIKENIGNISSIYNQEEILVGKLLEISFADELLPKNWLNSNVPVIFDFKGLDEIDKPNDLRQSVFCLLPLKDIFHRYLIQIPIQYFIETAKNGLWANFVNNCVNELQKLIQYRKQRQNIQSHKMYYRNVPFVSFKRRRPKLKSRKSPRQF